jgi:membrane protein involved in colicin uptake
MAIVSPDGKVKRVDPVGGSPLLVQAAEEAVSQWKFAAATAESREVIELHFSPKESQ